mgnify:CR=1 FL=1
MARDKAKEAEVARRVVALGEIVVRAAAAGEDPTFKIPIRALSNSRWNPKRSIIELGDATQERSLFDLGMAKKFMQSCLVASGVRDLLKEQKTTSIRDLFYMVKHTIPGTDENSFDEQEESDAVIEDLEVTVNSLREELHLFAENRGALVGEITIRDRGDIIDGRRMGSGGWSIPSIVEPEVIEFVKCTAKYILLVEKGAVWNRFNEDKYWEREKCILVHGQGQPPRGVRRLLSRMTSELRLPLYVLVDNDPWGYYIYSVVKQGSINLAYESLRMAVPSARFVGLSAFDPEKYRLPKDVQIRLDPKDVSRAKEIMAYPWFKGRRGWPREIKKMLDNGFKLEIEALSRKGISFITEEYLPRKLKEKDWLE